MATTKVVDEEKDGNLGNINPPTVVSEPTMGKLLDCWVRGSKTATATAAATTTTANSHHQADTIDKARSKFAICAEKGIEYLIRHRMIEDDPREIASFLQHCGFLDRIQIGEYLSDAKSKNQTVLEHYLEMLPMSGLSLEVALRRLLLRFKLPGEAQKIDRLMERFARHYFKWNPKIFSSPDTAYILSFSMILLNTDLHNPNNNCRMSKESFISNSRGIDNGSDLPESLLSEIFDAIAKNELTTECEGAFDYPLSKPDIEGMLWKKSDRFHSWNRRWCVVANGCLYYFYTRRDKSPRGVMPLEDLSIRPLDRRGKFRFQITADGVLQSYSSSSCSSNNHNRNHNNEGGEKSLLTLASTRTTTSTEAISVFALSINENDDRSSDGTIILGPRSTRSTMTSFGSSNSNGFFRSHSRPPLNLIKSAKYVNGQLVEGRRDRYIFQCTSKEERDRWVDVLCHRMRHCPVTTTTVPVQSSSGIHSALPPPPAPPSSSTLFKPSSTTTSDTFL